MSHEIDQLEFQKYLIRLRVIVKNNRLFLLHHISLKAVLEAGFQIHHLDRGVFVSEIQIGGHSH